MSSYLATNHDRDTLAALQPAAVVGYLRSKGWDQVRRYGENGAIFQTKVDEKEAEIIVPIERQARDFTSVMEVLLADVAEFEERSSADVLSDLSIAGFDVIQVRSPEADAVGSILLSAGVELHERARDMVLAAANIVASGAPRPSWRGRRFEEVDFYLSSLRLGQSKRGSFVISLLSRWEFVPPSQVVLQGLGLVDEPFGRRAAKALARALDATGTAIRRSTIEDHVSVFNQAVSNGVSANLCQSLADIAENGEGADISIRWSYTRPDPQKVLLKLRRDDVQLLREAAQRLTLSQPISDMQLQGVVTQIKEDPGSFDGIVTLEALVDGGIRRVRVEFDASDTDQRDKLIDAFKGRKRLSVSGDMTTEGRRLVLRNPQVIRIETDLDDEL